MCFDSHNLRGLHQFNWDGDIIIHESIVPSSRWVVGYPRKDEYNIDVREFLVNDRNEIIRHTLQHTLKKYIEKTGGDWDLFSERKPGGFDYRADLIASWVSESVGYIRRKKQDPWQFPDETLFVKEGDCEDRAFLIASLLLGSGISNFNVRVALGKVHTTDAAHKHTSYDHMWVMYKMESGHWTLIEPLCLRAHTRPPVKMLKHPARSRKPRIIARYTPAYLFNDQHLWAVAGGRISTSITNHLRLRANWKKWDPAFAGAVHQTIIQQALAGLPPSQHGVIDALNRRFHRAIFGVLGPVIDDIDRDLRHYTPIDHFDNAYIPEGWANVQSRLAQFKANNQDLDSFFHAAHAIADFYAHTSYVHLQAAGGAPAQVPIYDQDQPPVLNPSYTEDPFNLASGKFTVNDHYWKNQTPTPAVAWQGKLISGRYAQIKDTQPGLINQFVEGLCNIPDALLKDPGFALRGGLPHHNEIAVDEEAFDRKKHRLYNADQYAQQFTLRKDCAIRHVRKAFFDNWQGPK